MNKITLNNFIKEELNNHTKVIILTAIRDGRKSQKYKDELIFNKYSVEIIFPENSVTIYDDVFAEDEPLKLCLDEFVNTISKDEEE